MARSHLNLKISWKGVAGGLMISAGIGVTCFWWLYYRDVVQQTIDQRIPAMRSSWTYPPLPALPDAFPNTAPRVRQALRDAFQNRRPQL